MERGDRGTAGWDVLLRALYRLSSLKLAIVLLLWMAMVCIAATIIPQNPLPPPEDAALLKRLAGVLGPSDLFHSAWLIVPALALALNLLACTALGLRAFLRKDLFPGMPEGPCLERVIPGDADPGQRQQELARGLGREYRVRTAKRGQEWIVFGEKSSARAFAPVLAHGGILVVLLGAALGAFGFRGFMEIPEGSETDVVMLAQGGEMHLPFAVRCEKFTVEHYPNGMPREYRSELVFSKTGKAPSEQALMVNHPLRFGGVLFSQSGYNPVLKARLGVRKGDTLYHALAEEKTYFVLEEDRYQVNIVRLLPDVMHLGPAAELVVETPQGQKHLWVFKEFERFKARYPGASERMAVFDPSSAAPYTFTFEDLSTRWSTVLSLNHDPGETFVAVGALLFIAGIFILFLVPAGFVWVSLAKAPGGIRMRAVQMADGRARAPDEGVLGHLGALKGGRP
jgi:cytochrome c biogenesis protein